MNSMTAVQATFSGRARRWRGPSNCLNLSLEATLQALFETWCGALIPRLTSRANAAQVSPPNSRAESSRSMHGSGVRERTPLRIIGGRGRNAKSPGLGHTEPRQNTENCQGDPERRKAENSSAQVASVRDDGRQVESNASSPARHLRLDPMVPMYPASVQRIPTGTRA
jgi:hypothetical protein